DTAGHRATVCASTACGPRAGSRSDASCAQTTSRDFLLPAAEIRLPRGGGVRFVEVDAGLGLPGAVGERLTRVAPLRWCEDVGQGRCVVKLVCGGAADTDQLACDRPG